MSIESQCNFCNLVDKNTCKTEKQSKTCKYNSKLANPEITDDFDFGFSFMDEDGLESSNKIEELKSEKNNYEETIENLEKRIKLLYDSIVPFLDNLSKNPEKTTIHWPDRAEKIKQFKNKLKNISEGK